MVGSPGLIECGCGGVGCVWGGFITYICPSCLYTKHFQMVGSPGLIECGCGCGCVCVGGGGLHYVYLPLVSIYKAFSDGGFPWATVHTSPYVNPALDSPLIIVAKCYFSEANLRQYFTEIN